MFKIIVCFDILHTRLYLLKYQPSLSRTDFRTYSM